jgi:hypothetical protein
MAAYFRHLKDVFLEAEIRVTQDNVKLIDWAIHEIAGVQYNDDFEVWQRIKPVVEDSAKRQIFIQKLKEKAEEEGW